MGTLMRWARTVLADCAALTEGPLASRKEDDDVANARRFASTKAGEALRRLFGEATGRSS